MSIEGGGAVKMTAVTRRITFFARRWEEGYDLSDPKYNAWLKLRLSRQP